MAKDRPSNPFDKLRLLSEQIDQIAEEFRLETISINYTAEHEGGDIVSIFLGIDPDAVKTETERAIDKDRETFDDIINNALEVGEADEDGVPLLSSKEDLQVESNPLLEELRQRSEEKRGQAKSDLEDWLKGDGDDKGKA